MCIQRSAPCCVPLKSVHFLTGAFSSTGCIHYIAFIHLLPGGNLECSQCFPPPLSMSPNALHVPVCLQKMYPAEVHAWSRSKMGVVSFLRFSAPKQELLSVPVLVSILLLIATRRITLSQWLSLSVPASSPVRGR